MNMRFPTPSQMAECGGPCYTQARAVLERWGRPATPQPEPPTSQITFNAPSPPEEVIRLDKKGFHYKGQFVADAGEAHRLMMAFLEQNTKTKPKPPTAIEIIDLSIEIDDAGLGIVEVVRGALERWGHG